LSEKNKPSAAKHSGPKRNDECHRAILDAAEYSLGTDGYANFSIEKVAARAGVGKQTIYRWWGSKALLVLEVFRDRLLPLTEHYDGSSPIQKHLKKQLLAFGQHISKTNCQQAIICLIAEMHRNSKLMEMSKTSILSPRLDIIYEALELAVTLGQISPKADHKVIVDQLWGGIWYKVIIKNEPVTTRFTNSLVDQVFTGLLSE